MAKAIEGITLPSYYAPGNLGGNSNNILDALLSSKLLNLGKE